VSRSAPSSSGAPVAEPGAEPRELRAELSAEVRAEVRAELRAERRVRQRGRLRLAGVEQAVGLELVGDLQQVGGVDRLDGVRRTAAGPAGPVGADLLGVQRPVARVGRRVERRPRPRPDRLVVELRPRRVLLLPAQLAEHLVAAGDQLGVALLRLQRGLQRRADRQHGQADELLGELSRGVDGQRGEAGGGAQRLRDRRAHPTRLPHAGAARAAPRRRRAGDPRCPVCGGPLWRS
jgi:hypothetical protein